MGVPIPIVRHHYENPGHHDDDLRNLMRGNDRWNSKKSMLPENHVDLFMKSVPFEIGEQGKIVRYARDENGVIHRFFTTRDVFHWAGSTRGYTKSGEMRSFPVPPEVMRYFRGN